MSAGQKPRNPRYFPKMKVRGARRRNLAAFQRVTGAFDRTTISAFDAAESFRKLALLVGEGR